MPDVAVAKRFLHLARRHREPVVVQTLRSTAAATLSYLAALWLTDVQAPLLAPLTALLVVQVTLFATLTTGVRRVNSVVAGVVLATGFSELVGLSWWSLGLLILCALVMGHVVRAGEFVPEVAISAMLVLGVTQVAATAFDRVAETLIGAVVGLLFNVVFVPPVWVAPAQEHIEEQARRMRRLLLRLSDEVDEGPTPLARVSARLAEARRLDQDVAQVDASLSQAEESLRLNPRVKEGLLTRMVLRTGLDTLETCAVLLRTLAHTLTDLAAHRSGEPLFPDEVAVALRELFTHLGDAVATFAVLITSQVSTSAEQAEARLFTELETSRATRERVARLLLARVQEHPRQWQLHGSLLANVDRILDELDIERRSAHLAEELDRYSRERYKRRPGRLRRVRERLTPG